MVSTAPLPSVFIVQTDVLAPRALTKRIFVPSGDQSGSASSCRLVAVRFVCPVPFAFIVKTSLFPEREESNASLVPSGLQPGLRSAPGAFVRFVWPVPLAFMTQMSMPAPRSLWNAIFVPLGENAGAPLVPTEVSACLLLPSLAMTHTWPALSQAMRLPSGESDGRESAAALFVSRVTPVPAGLIE